MNPEHSGNPAARDGGKPCSAAPDDLVTVHPSQLQQGEPLPMNFIVLPHEEAGADARAPDGDHARVAARQPLPDEPLPVPTVGAEPPGDAMTAAAAADQLTPDPFQPSVFGPRLRQPHDDALHADPDSAPASVAAAGARAPGKKKKSAGTMWAVVILLLLLAAAAWWWTDRHGLVWPFAARVT